MSTDAAKEALISLKDKFTLSPIEKHVYYKKFPYKLVLHILLVVLTTIQVCLVVDSDYTEHAREQFRVFKYILLVLFTTFFYIFSKGVEEDQSSQKFLTTGDFQIHLQTLIEDFKTMNSQLYQHYSSRHANFTLGIYYATAFSHSEAKMSDIFPVNISSGKFGPIDPSDASSVRYWTSVARLAQLQANNIVTTIKTLDGSRACMSWNISIDYNFETLSQVQAQIDVTNRYCSVQKDDSDIILVDFKHNNYFVNIIVLITSTICLILSLRHVYAVAKVYMTAKFYYQGISKNKEYANYLKKKKDTSVDLSANEDTLNKFLEMNLAWEDIPFSEKMKFFNFWFILGTIGNCIQIIASLSIMLTFQRNVGQEILTRDHIFIGFGCFFAWFQLMYYLKFSRDIILLTSTFSKSVVENMVFFGFALPLFMGFSILGQALFWDYDRFSSTGETFKTLISMACGYIVYDAFDETWDEGLVRQLFFFFFLLTFYTSMQEIFVSIIMEGYDRCTIRKEIDNDDPFPMLQSLKQSAKKFTESTISDKNKEINTETNLSPLVQSKNSLSPTAHMDSLPINGSRDGQEGDSVIYSFSPFEQEVNLMKVCLSKLNRKRIEALEKLNVMCEEYTTTINENSFSRDDADYLHDLYHESLNRILMKIQRYDTLLNPKKK